MWKKILTKGLRSIINEAKENIENFTKEQHSGIDKVIFWQAVEIVLEAAIHHAHRYAELAECMAEQETDFDKVRRIKGNCADLQAGAGEPGANLPRGPSINGHCGCVQKPRTPDALPSPHRQSR